MSTSWVEIPQERTVPLLEWLSLLLQVISLRLDVISDDQFNCALGSSVWIRRTNWAVLGDGNHVWHACRVTVDGGRGGEDDVGDIVFCHAS